MVALPQSGTMSSFSALTLLVGQQEKHSACKNLLLQTPSMRVKGETGNPDFLGKWLLNDVCVLS